jgi:hypothetical protein
VHQTFAAVATQLLAHDPRFVGGQLVEAGILLRSDDRRQGGLARAGAAVEGNVLQGGSPLACGVEHQPSVFFKSF